MAHRALEISWSRFIHIFLCRNFDWNVNSLLCARLLANVSLHEHPYPSKRSECSAHACHNEKKKWRWKRRCECVTRERNTGDDWTEREWKRQLWCEWAFGARQYCSLCHIVRTENCEIRSMLSLCHNTTVPQPPRAGRALSLSLVASFSNICSYIYYSLLFFASLFYYFYICLFAIHPRPSVCVVCANMSLYRHFSTLHQIKFSSLAI